MRILPVLDLLGGDVVRGVAGQRQKYRPIESRLVDGAVPLDVARAIRDQLGLTELYVADLDAIEHDRPDFETLERLAGDGGRLMVDAGLRDVERAVSLVDLGVAAVIAGLETSPGPDHLRKLLAAVGPDRLVFSLDLVNARPLGRLDAWRSGDPESIAAEAVEEAGVRRLIVLELAGIGIGQGPATLPLCRLIRQRCPDLELITGGGIRGADDLVSLADAGVDAALVASAIHDGSLGRNDVMP